MAAGRTIAVWIEQLPSPWGASVPGYAVCARSGASRTEPARGRVLAALDTAAGGPFEIDAAAAIDIPAEISSETALLAPPLADALRAWDLVGLEIGSAAVVTGGLPWWALMAVTARWYGAVPVVAGGQPLGGDDATMAIDASDMDAVASFGRTLSGFAAVCAVELSGRADAVDLLLEAIPRYAHVLFAGPRQDRFTIDYYVNVHRKGLHLSSTVLSPLHAFGGGASDRARLQRALRLLASPARAAACAEAVGRAAAVALGR